MRKPRPYLFCLLMLVFSPGHRPDAVPDRTPLSDIPTLSMPASPIPASPIPAAATDTLSGSAALVSYSADISQGIIGPVNDKPIDDPYDNIFHVLLPAGQEPSYAAWLEYELYGVSDHTGVARSINEGLAVGGHFVRFRNAWTLQRERIPVSLLRSGDNIIRFTIPQGTSYHYEIRHLRIIRAKNPDAAPAILINQPDKAYYGGQAYLKGIVVDPVARRALARGPIKLFCGDQPVELYNNEFELVVSRPDTCPGPFTIHLSAVLPSGKIIRKEVAFDASCTPDTQYVASPKGIAEKGWFVRNKGVRIDWKRPDVYAGIRIPAGALPENHKEISVTALRQIDLPALQADLVNVTRGSAGFRFLPHGTRFSVSAKLAIGYDSSLIPEGYTAADIRTYFFEERSRQWIALPLDTIAAGIIFSRTNHFTDMIDGIIKVPESPQTQGYTPTTIKDLKAADPAAGITLIAPPEAGNTGAVNMQYPLKLPAGRHSMQPNLILQYNSEGGNGWLGLGWNLSVPSIGIELRWGVPRYDPSLETETYTLSGEQLAPLAIQGALVPRTAERQFYRRVEGSFDRIIRHGNSPANYWWEITNKNGVRNFYGGTPATGVVSSAVLEDAAGHIAHWALVETIDLNSNFVHYIYNTVTDPGIAGGQPGLQLYLSQILYTGNGTTDGPYSVAFTTDRELGESKRKDIEINCRLGLKTVTADLLRKISISFNGQPVRSYECTYTQGEFSKTLLASITEFDAAGALFYTHQFTYFDDFSPPGGSLQPADNAVNWNMPANTITGNLVNSFKGFSSPGSALSTSQSTNYGGGLAVTIGSTGDFWSKAGTLGGSFGFSQSNQEGRVTMIDINGDGLPDQVIEYPGQLYFRPNLGGPALGFGPMKPINGITSFSSSSSQSTSEGIQIIPFFSGFLGYNHANSSAITTNYFADFNGDGLMDIASCGQVYFNHLDANGDPTFTTTSTPTPNPITTGATVDKAFLAPDTALQASQEANFPLQDVIRLWQAPFDGTISVNAPVQLVVAPGSNGIADPIEDGVRTSIQLRGTVLWGTTIPAYDVTTQTPTGVSNLTVHKGDNLYFRVQSIYNGVGDTVSWNPIIDYQTPPSPDSDANNRISSHYQASADFALQALAPQTMGKDGTVMVTGNFNKTYTSDTVVLSVSRVSKGVTTVLYQHAYADSDLAQGTLPALIVNVAAGDSLFCNLTSSSYIDLTTVQWQPQYQYTLFADGTQAVVNGSSVLQGGIVPILSNYDDWLVNAGPVYAQRADTVSVQPVITPAPSATGTLTFTVKTINHIVAKRSIQLLNGVVVNDPPPITLLRDSGETYYFDMAAADRSLATAIGQPRAQIIHDSIVIDKTTGNPDTIATTTTVNINLYTQPAEDYFGLLFRGWGQFVFKGQPYGTAPLDETQLNQNELSNYPTDPSVYTANDSALFKTLPNPATTNFVTLYASSPHQSWADYDSSIFVKGSTMSSSRLWMHDVGVDSLMDGEPLGAAEKITNTSTDTYSLGISPIVSFSYGNSTSQTTTSLDMLDLNGDRYPDVVSQSNAQFTLPNGGLEGIQRALAGNPVETNGSSTGFTLGGNYPLAYSQGKDPSANADNAQQIANVSIGLSGNAGSNSSTGQATWIDINGDGLPDKVSSDGTVWLNLGYSFLGPEQWSTGPIDQTNSNAFGAGLGVNIISGTIEGGFGLTNNNSTDAVTLADINGDGLPDQLTNTNGELTAVLNTGNGFNGAHINWTGNGGVNNSLSTGESINAAFTIPIDIPIIFIKICINPSFSTGHGVSCRQFQLMDLDGDGYPDVLESVADGALSVQRSRIGRTNLLKMVQRPLGGYFSVDYQRVGNTYSMPQSKWVMSNLEVFDGLHSNGVDTIRNSFTYSGGVYNRREREFYGFGTVTTNNLNTAAGNCIYRSHIRNYLNATYYTKGLRSSEWVQDAAGNRYTETDYLYELRSIQDSSEFPAGIQTTRLWYEGQPSAGAYTTIQYNYDALGNITTINDAGDGTPQDQILAAVTYFNNTAAYIESIPSSITVTTTDGIKRKRTDVIDAHGNVTRIQQYLADGSSANYDMTYDAYGNLSQITRPANYKGDRLSYSYIYDDPTHTYITKVTDAYGYSSSSTYDYRFGALTASTAITNEQIRYTLDNSGRISTIIGPYELAAGKPYTISFSYYPTAAVPYAMTRHYDPEYDADILTYNFADGLGRSVQVKKQISLFKAKNQPDSLVMVVGGRQIFDAMGRSTNTYYPTIEAVGPGNTTLFTGLGNPLATKAYDVLDRPLSTVLADGATTSNVYTTTGGQFSTYTTDPMGNKQQLLTDVRNRQRTQLSFSGPSGTITTSYNYDALSELLKVTDNNGNSIVSTYDNLGRRLSVQHPDAGLTTFVYDPASNMTLKTTAAIAQQIPKGGAITYEYQYERLTAIDYPIQYQNTVKFTYGAAGTGDRTGRLTLQEDASGGEEFFYGPLGEITKTIRTILINSVYSNTFVSQQQYDTWNRVTSMTYADGELVTYHYNRGGSLLSVSGAKLGDNYSYINQLGYDQFEQRIYLQYGNGTEMHYAYDSLRRRLIALQAFATGNRPILNNSYRYDFVSDVLGIVNNIPIDTGKLGGYARQQYGYDNLYRLVSASGIYKGGAKTTGYSLAMGYDNLDNITSKTRVDSVLSNNYNLSYNYGGGPHQLSQLGAAVYKYDPDGNNILAGNTERFWDEDNRMMAVINNGVLSEYTYDAVGERVIKSSGGVQGIWVNGAPAGQIQHTDNYTAYVSPYLVCRKNSFTKHFYIGSERICTKIGHGVFANISFPQSGITAGGIDYTQRAAQLAASRTAYYASLGVSPGPPTMEDYYALPQNSGIQPPVIVDSTAATVPPGWPGNTTPPPNGPPIFVNPTVSNDSVQAGYGFQGTGQIYEADQFFYHPDHLGSTSYVTDVTGEVSQHVEYVPFGETFFEEHEGTFTTPYLFNGKERDDETGLYYYGARYYDPKASQWQSVDPKAEKYPGLSPYNFAMDNPVRFVDPNGMELFEQTNSSPAEFSTEEKNSCVAGEVVEAANLPVVNLAFPNKNGYDQGSKVADAIGFGSDLTLRSAEGVNDFVNEFSTALGGEATELTGALPATLNVAAKGAPIVSLGLTILSEKSQLNAGKIDETHMGLHIGVAAVGAIAATTLAVPVGTGLALGAGISLAGKGLEKALDAVAGTIAQWNSDLENAVKEMSSSGIIP